MRNRPPETTDSSEIQPWHSQGGLEHVCELYKSSLVLYGIFTELARMVYHDPDGRLTGTPSVLWRSGGTEIWIDSELRWEDQHPEVRPAIYVQLGQIQAKPYIQGSNGKVLAADRFGERQYAVNKVGTVTFMHVARTSGEACSLADNTEYALSLLQDPICRDFCFTRFELVGRAPLEKLPRESSERYASAVTFQYAFDSVWSVKEECPVLKAVDLIHDEEPEISESDVPGRHKTVSRANIFTENKGSGVV